jgi:AcrR family transcriptional regulator
MAANAPNPDPFGAEPGRRYRGLSAADRRADQRRRIVRAAIDEFAARGFHHTSVEDIVRSARTSRTAFYAFFDNREDAMYGAVQASLRDLLDRVRGDLDACTVDDDLARVGVASYVDWLVAHPAEARIVLVEGVGISPEVNALRSRMRREMAQMIRDIWSTHDDGRSTAPDAETIAVGVFGMLFESMVDLIERGRLEEAPARVSVLVEAISKVLATAQ